MDTTPTMAPYRIHRYPSALIDRIPLADGRRVTLRPVLPQDFEAEERFVAGLSRETRQRRFHIGIHTLPEPMLRAFTEVDFRTHVALVAEAGYDVEAPILVADARYVVHDDGANAEFAIAVADDWQGVGLGRQLLMRLGDYARRSGLQQLCGDVLRGNTPMIELVRSLGGRVRTHPEDVLLMRACFDCGTSSERQLVDGQLPLISLFPRDERGRVGNGGTP